MRRLAEKTKRLTTIVPTDLYQRLVRRAAQETTDRGLTITPSQIVRWAVEEYMDTWAGATLVPAPAPGKES